MALHFDLVDLRLFVYIAEENSLTRAAARANMSLSAASVRVKHLEEAIGVKLLNRAAQGITLLPPGQAFLHHARQVVDQLRQLRSDMHEYSAGVKGHIRISVNTTAITEFIPSVLRSFLVSHPDVYVDLRERLSHDIVRAVSEGGIDIGIVAGSVRTEGLAVLPYRRDRLVLATAAGHPLAKKSSVGFLESLDYDHIGLHEGSAINSFLNQAAGCLGKQLKMRIQVNSFDAVCRMIEADAGIGILPESAALRHARTLSISIVELTDDWAARNLLICVRDLESLPGFARDLIDLLLADSES
jgi:DNA-binding transcriptional LysR family regulator